MTTADKDLEGLRKEYKDLSDYTGRIAVVVLTVLCLLVVSFSRACNKVRGDEVKTTLCQIHKANEQAGSDCDIKVSYIFGFHERQYYSTSENTCALSCFQGSAQGAITPANRSPSPSASVSPAPTPSPSSGPSAKEPPTSNKESTQETELLSPGAGAMEDSRASTLERSATADQRKGLDLFCNCQRTLEAGLDAKAQGWFEVKSPVPGVDIRIDLRYWIFSLPIIFCLCAVYLHILRKKLNVLRATAIARMNAAEPEEISAIDRLYFEGDPPYMSFPSKLSAALFVCCYLFLPVYMGYVAVTSWDYGGTAIVFVAPLVLTCAFFAIAYSHHVSCQFNQQIAAITGIEEKPGLIARMLTWSKGLVRKLARRVNPRVPLLIGALIVLATLVFGVSQKNWEQTYTGYAFAWRSEGNWLTSVDAMGNVNNFYSELAWLVYLMALLVAILVLFLVIVRPLYSLLKKRSVGKLALGIAGGVFVFSLLDLSTYLGILFQWRTGLQVAIKIAIWLLTVGLWLRYSVWKGKANPQQWRRVRSVLIILYAPFFLLASFLALVNAGLILIGVPVGLVAFFSGTSLIFLGLIHVQYRVRLAEGDSGET